MPCSLRPTRVCSSLPGRGFATVGAARSWTPAAWCTRLSCAMPRAADCARRDRRAFFAYASQVMRSVIVSSARERAAQKRGSGLRPITLSERISEQVLDDEDAILRVHEALESLEQVDARLARVVQMRYFGGYSEQEIADTLGVTERHRATTVAQGPVDVAGGRWNRNAHGFIQSTDDATG